MFVNIIACGRNGSTLLIRLLDGHKKLTVYPNEVNLLRIDKKKRKSKIFFLKYLKKEIKELNQINLKNIKKKARNKKSKFFWTKNLDFLENLFNNYIKQFGKFYKKNDTKIKIFKSTDVENIEKYQTNFPQMKFIHLVRDPITNYESLKRSRLEYKKKTIFQNQKSLLENFIEYRWKKHVNFYFNNAIYNPEQHLLIKYEDLCNRTNPTINKILKFLKSKNKKIINTQTIFNGQNFVKLPNSSSEKKIPTNIKALNLRSKYNYSNIVDKSEIYFINLNLGKFMRRLNYKIKNLKTNKITLLKPKSWEFDNFLKIKELNDVLVNLLFPFLYIKYKIYKLTLLIKN